ncbi:MAG: porin [Acidobacteriota bacterium]
MNHAVSVMLVLGVALSGPASAGDEENKKSWAELGDGFQIESADGENTLRIGARIQLRSTLEDPEIGSSRTSFRVRRLKFKLSGRVLGQVDYKIQANLAGGSVTLEDALLVYTKKPLLRLWAGQGKIFFGRQNLTSSGHQQFVDRSIVSNVIEAARDQGVALIGQNTHKTFEYQIGVYNGNGINASSNDDDHLQYTGRVVFTPLGEYPAEESALDRPESSRLALGAKILLEEVDDMLGTVTDKTLAGVEVAYKIGGFNTVAEYFHRTDDVTVMALSTETDTDVYYVQLAYLFAGKPIEVALRLAEIRPDVAGPSMDRRETGAAVSWYLKKHAHKLQFDLRKLEDDGNPANDTTEARLQLQLAF